MELYSDLSGGQLGWAILNQTKPIQQSSNIWLLVYDRNQTACIHYI